MTIDAIALKNQTPTLFESEALKQLQTKYAGLLQIKRPDGPYQGTGAWSGNLILAIAAARAKYIEGRMQRGLDQIDRTQKLTDGMNNALEVLAPFAKGYSDSGANDGNIRAALEAAIQELPEGDPLRKKIQDFMDTSCNGKPGAGWDGAMNEQEVSGINLILQDAVKEFDRDSSKKNLELQKMSNDLAQVWQQGASLMKELQDTAMACIRG
ncbi:hypothetical protein AKJ09_06578 [Labilithrix luteola]|uniref:Uncharacterized protein n=1 Tax=Labilithrix luteola TaxID=1391654 RepID=A0A0K1Q3G8_9BACT|nr:hypothetical protein [Labilithrix luteola]AKU99914.1 hypothetical protein AKJ09_06578 [Labilithrix luteola]